MSIFGSRCRSLGAVIRLCTVALTLGSIAVPNARAVTIDWVTVDDAGNAPDASNPVGSFGAVPYEYQIMKYEWTNSQYVSFLNAVDPEGLNSNGIYNEFMGTQTEGGISRDAGATEGSRYAIRPNMGDKPVNYVSWFAVARVSNWLQAGAQTYGSSAAGAAAIDDGAYTLGGATTGVAPAKNPGASYYVPTDNEWYKAAYYKGGGLNAGYWLYPTQTDEVPGSIAADTVGNGSAGSSGNSANYDKDFAGSSGWNGASENVTTVGTNGGPSAYGAFDMAGNIREYNDRRDGTSVGTRGGDYSTFNADNFKPYYSIEFFDEFYYFSGSTFAADSWAPNQGFRLAAIAPVPEPSTCAMAFAGLACGGYLVRRRRKQA